MCQSTDPKDQRLRSCVVVECDGKYILIDTGPDLRMQMLKGAIPRIDAILYTHEHNDHVIGLDDIRPYNFKQKAELPVYGLPRVLDEVHRRFAYAFDGNGYPGAPKATLHPISGDNTLHICGVDIVPIHVEHGRLPILGYRVGDFGFITDANAVTEKETAKLKGVHTLVVNALHHRQHPAHFNLEEALAFIEKVGPSRAYITHVSHFMGKYADWTQRLPADVFAAYDGLVLDL